MSLMPHDKDFGCDVLNYCGWGIAEICVSLLADTYCVLEWMRRHTIYFHLLRL